MVGSNALSHFRSWLAAPFQARSAPRTGKADTLRGGLEARLLELALPPIERFEEPGLLEPLADPLQGTPRLATAAPAQRLKRTPSRKLRWHEVPNTSRERVISLAEGCEQPLDARHAASLHASRLYVWITDPKTRFDEVLNDPPISSGRAERGLFGWQLEQAYYNMCFELWWLPHRWRDVGGVADHFRRLLKREPRYRWCPLSPAGVEDGAEHRRIFYFLPKANIGLGKKRGKGTPKHKGKGTPKRTPRAKPRRLGGKRRGAEVIPIRRAA